MGHPIDNHVGKRIRQRRWLLRKTQVQLGETTGVKFQQIQKYETGANRVSASRLYEIAEALEVEVSYFFQGLAEGSNSTQAPEIANPGEAKLIADYRATAPESQAVLSKLADQLAAPAHA